MPTLYIASTETFVGKSAVSIGLLQRMHNDGFQVGYMKSVSVSALPGDVATIQEDIETLRQMIKLDAPPEQIAPVLITPSVIESVMQGKAPAFTEQLLKAHEAMSQGRDVTVVEGSNTWAEGAIVGLTSMRVIELLQASSLLVSRYRSLHSVDVLLSVKRFLGDSLTGVLFNQVDPDHVDYVRHRVMPYLESEGIPVMGILPQDRVLASVTVNELLEHLGGQLIGDRAWCDRSVEALLVGSMGTQSALSHFRRQRNKAVITGGDRVDLQLTALETSTSVLVLTGNISPSIRVMVQAEDRQVPIIVVPGDTLETVERADKLFGHVPFHEQAKLERFTKLMNEHFDFVRLYNTLQLHRT